MADIYTQVGEEMVADYVSADSWWIAWGTGAGTAAKGDTTLFTEASEARVVPAVSQPAPDQNQFVGTLQADGAKTITNAGVFDASTAGQLFIKSDFAGLALALNDSIEFTFTITWS